MLRGHIKSRLVLLVYIVGALPTSISSILYPGSSENQINQSYVSLQVSLTKFFGISIFVVIAFLLILDIQFSGLRLTILAMVFFPFLVVIIVSSFRRDSYVLQTSFQILFYVIIINSRNGDEWDLKKNILRISLIVSIFEVFFIFFGGPIYWQDCRSDKCLFSGQKIFIAEFASGNSASVYFATLSVVVSTFTIGIPRLIYSTFFGVLCLLGGGRNAVIALAVFYAVTVFKSLFLRRIFLALSSFSTLLPLFLTFPDDFATYRGYLWNQTKIFILESGGYAPTMPFRDFVASQLMIVPKTTEAPHNIWLGIWWDGGYPGLVSFTPIFLLILFYSGKSNRQFIIPVLVYFYMINATDPISSFTHFDSYSWFLFIILITVFDQFKTRPGRISWTTKTRSIQE